MRLKRFLSLILCCVMLASLAVPASAAMTITVDPINVMVGGKVFLPTDVNGKDVPIFVYGGTTYAPLRALAEAYGLTVGYNAEKRLATVDGTPSADFVGTKGTKQALTKRTSLSVSSINIEVNGEVFRPKDANGKDVSVFVYNGTTYAPLRALAEAYGLTVGYNGEKKLAAVDFVADVTITTNYDPIIDYYDIPFELGHPQYNVDEIQQMIQDNLTLDEVAAKLSTLADVIQYLHQKGYGESGGDLEVEYSNIEWHLSRSAQTVFSENRGNCGGGSNLINYILRGDFDEQGYVQESSNEGGHIYNYFKQDGVYYFFDMVQIVHGGDYAHKSYQVFEASDPQEFSNQHIRKNHATLESDAPKYRLFQYMYAWEGSSLPVGCNSQCKTVLGRSLMNILSGEIERSATILYVAEDKYAPVFREAPPKELWPANAR